MDILSALGITVNPIIAKIEAGKSLKRDEATMILLYQVVSDNKELKDGTQKLLDNNDRLANSVTDLAKGIVDLKVAISELKGRLT